MNPSFWNGRFSSTEYAYGTEPNVFLKEQIERLEPGKILFPAEGEGRNAVFAASLGWDVTAFDFSIAAKAKALMLAARKGVHIEYLTGTFESLGLADEMYDCVAICWAHLPPGFRPIFHQFAQNVLKEDGVIIIEGFAKDQLGRYSGGPKHPDMLFSVEELQEDFEDLGEFTVDEKLVILSEGTYHQGEAAVVRLVGKKCSC
ncbi:methyltransferase domain-containing protein [Pontibacter sp. G13]|uniref:class I SAM-dependent methyltransferase n=1 Tax=Pontibacter sp. G13 TaxID=3074898 RepID=UPI00288BFEA0|nr:methyltransferase domain-containing protein [Pontibacter sp. G13]WNJ20664.1 methyltransferase domain-containing protein [Pontibacter sp. G13]